MKLITTEDLHKIKHLKLKVDLFFKSGTWLHNDQDNHTAKQMWIKYIGSENQYRERTKTSCGSCSNKQIGIYKDLIRYANI